MSALTDESASGYPVQVELHRPLKSSRLLLIFRGFLLLPHFFFALPVILIAAVLVLVNYLTVLIAGRAAAVGFLSGTLRYLLRLSAYSYFLTDKYPPFSLSDDPDYPVRVTVRPPGHIHRWRVFSGVLATPHILILYALLLLAAITSLISFVVVLIAGRYPPGLFNIVAAALRYQARVNAYLYLIVDRYPPFSLA